MAVHWSSTNAKSESSVGESAVPLRITESTQGSPPSSHGLLKIRKTFSSKHKCRNKIMKHEYNPYYAVHYRIHSILFNTSAIYILPYIRNRAIIIKINYKPIITLIRMCHFMLVEICVKSVAAFSKSQLRNYWRANKRCARLSTQHGCRHRSFISVVTAYLLITANRFRIVS